MSLIYEALEGTALSLDKRERHTIRRAILGRSVGNTIGTRLANKGLLQYTGKYLSGWEVTPLGLKVFRIMPGADNSVLHPLCVERLREKGEWNV